VARHDNPGREGTDALKVAFAGRTDPQVRALVRDSEAEIVPETTPADVVHLTTDPESAVDAVDALLGSTRVVILHLPSTALDAAAISQLATRAAERGTVVTFPLAHRYYPMVRLARRRVRSGTPGPLHLLHGWSIPEGVLQWCDLVEFTTRHHINNISATSVDTPWPDPIDGVPQPTGATGLIFETDRGAVGTLAVSHTRPLEGGSLVATLDGAEESIGFHEGRPEVLDVMGRRGTQRYQRGIGADVSRYSTQPAGRPQGHRDCMASFVADAHAAARGAAPDGLPGLDDLSRSSSLAAAIRESLATATWAPVSSQMDLELLTSNEGKTA
jgi:predicted dehydrogenase